MGLFSKLFGEAVGKAANDMMTELKKTIEKETEKKPVQSTIPNGYVIPSSDPKPTVNAPFGVSWGEEMPAEENQFSYNGPYYEYFDNIFRTEFPEYRIEREFVGGTSRTNFRFFRGTDLALVVEVLPQNSSVQKLRSDCRRAGIPYLRYYYNHDGWWNTRNYVVNRTRHAL